MPAGPAGCLPAGAAAVGSALVAAATGACGAVADGVTAGAGSVVVALAVAFAGGSDAGVSGAAVALLSPPPAIFITRKPPPPSTTTAAIAMPARSPALLFFGTPAAPSSVPPPVCDHGEGVCGWIAPPPGTPPAIDAIGGRAAVVCESSNSGTLPVCIHCISAAWNSAALWKRCGDSRAIALRMIAPKPGSRSGTNCSGGGGTSSTILKISSLKVSALNGTCPVMASYRMTPTE